MLGSFETTSQMRSPAAEARGHIMKMTESIMTENRTCIAYWMIAIRSPTWNEPASMSCAPSHTMSTIAMFRMSEMAGMSAIMRRATAMFVSARSLFALEKRASSYASRQYARMTRMPVSPSRVTRFRLSMRACSERSSGSTQRMTTKASSRSTGMAANTTMESSPFMRQAATAAPTSMIGDIIASVIPICTKRSSCCTSLVVRVMSDEVPISSISGRLNALTRR